MVPLLAGATAGYDDATAPPPGRRGHLARRTGAVLAVGAAEAGTWSLAALASLTDGVRRADWRQRDARRGRDIRADASGNQVLDSRGPVDPRRGRAPFRTRARSLPQGGSRVAGGGDRRTPAPRSLRCGAGGPWPTSTTRRTCRHRWISAPLGSEAGLGVLSRRRLGRQSAEEYVDFLPGRARRLPGVHPPDGTLVKTYSQVAVDTPTGPWTRYRVDRLVDGVVIGVNATAGRAEGGSVLGPNPPVTMQQSSTSRLSSSPSGSHGQQPTRQQRRGPTGLRRWCCCCPACSRRGAPAGCCRTVHKPA